MWAKTLFRSFCIVLITAFSGGVFYLYTHQASATVIERPDFEHTSHQNFVSNVNQCIDYVYHTEQVETINRELLIAQAVLETGWGTSRFAQEGKNLFGIRTYDLREPHMLPWKDKPQKWGVKVFQHECDSVAHYINLLNTGTAFKDYQDARFLGEDNPYVLVETLDNYASDKDYFAKVKRIIRKLRKEYKIG